MKLAIAALLATSAAAFAPSAQSGRSATTQLHETKADLQSLAKDLNPAIGFYDPLGLADADFWGSGNEATIGFLREAEVKHGRIAMFAFVGYIVHANGITWPWPMTLEGDAFPTGLSPPEAWDAIPDIAKLQIFWFVGFLEFWREVACEKHYMKGGKIGEFPAFDAKFIPGGALNLYDPFGRNKNMSEEQKEKRLRAEINNGRLAQLGIFGFISEAKMEGAVPALKGVIPHYDGDVMAPMTKSILPFVIPEYAGPSL
jgi:hypothetical protein